MGAEFREKNRCGLLDETATEIETGKHGLEQSSFAFRMLPIGSYFPSFFEPRRMAEKALTAVVQEAHVKEISTLSVLIPAVRLPAGV